MKIVFFGKGSRALACLQKLLEEEFQLNLLVLQPGDSFAGEIGGIAEARKISIIAPDNPNSDEAVSRLQEEATDVFVLAGYGKILRPVCIDIPRQACINLHGGLLPGYRGSSPLNWALINDEPELGVSIIEVAPGIDTGSVLCERRMKVTSDTTIANAHDFANRNFPDMLLEVLRSIEETGAARGPEQTTASGCYYPRRFPDDGIVFWDQLTAREVHNRIRALTEPYPCARTFCGGREVRLISSEFSATPLRGEPGRIYRKSRGRLLVGARDEALWISEARFMDDDSPVHASAEVYQQFATVHEASVSFYRSQLSSPTS